MIVGQFFALLNATFREYLNDGKAISVSPFVERAIRIAAVVDKTHQVAVSRGVQKQWGRL